MKQLVINQIIEVEDTISNNPEVHNLKKKIVNKFMGKDVSVFNLLEYIRAQIYWRNYSQLIYLVALTKVCCDELNLDFFSLDKDRFTFCESYNDVYNIIK